MRTRRSSAPSSEPQSPGSPDKGATERYGGFIVVYDEAESSKQLEKLAEAHRSFTEAVSMLDWKSEQLEIVLISLAQEKISWVGLMTRGKTVASLKHHIKFAPLFHFPPLHLEELEAILALSLKNYLTRSASGPTKRLPPELWRMVIDTIRKKHPDMAPSLDHLDELRRTQGRVLDSEGHQVVAQERDAVQIAARIFGLNDELAKFDWSVPKEGPPRPFLDRPGTGEDRMIEYDSGVLLGNWARRDFIGGKIFRKPGHQLRVLNINRDRPEHTLGVDLVYFNKAYNSFVLVQYKRLNAEPHSFTYRPSSDLNFQKDMERITGLLKSAQEEDVRELEEYRLHPGPFYFKFCPSIQLEVNSTEMIKGFYTPFDYLQLFLKLDRLGPRGGRVINYDTVKRWMSNTLFIHLVQEGWVGSQRRGTVQIEEIVKSLLDVHRSVIFAEESPEPNPKEKTRFYPPRRRHRSKRS